MPVIQIDNVSKSYRLGAIGGGTLREDVARWWARFRGRPDPFLKIGQEHKARPTDAPPTDYRSPITDHRLTDLFWALRNVSLEVKEGEILGIIGRNGAGKSTLLKILSRVTGPTEGEIRVRGRIASLLEVGTGFHPELTGRENVFLNGAILGMTKPEIRRKFDEIVDFSGVEQFIDTPVKRYSSGMYVRLAFAVAAHLEPEILVVDEVLAVGDAEFQTRCIGKMNEVAKGGRTVLFVSHNMPAVERLCSRAVLLRSGCIQYRGSALETVRNYLENSTQGQYEWTRTAPYPGHPHILRAWLCEPDGAVCCTPTSSSLFGIGIDISVPTPTRGLLLGVGIANAEQQYLFATGPLDCNLQVPSEHGVYRTYTLFPPAIFMPKRYYASLSLYTSTELFDSQPFILGFDVADAPSLANNAVGGRVGDLQIQCEWRPFVRCG